MTKYINWLDFWSGLQNVKKRGHIQIFLMAFRGYLESKVSFKWFKNVATHTFLMLI